MKMPSRTTRRQVLETVLGSSVALAGVGSGSLPDSELADSREWSPLETEWPTYGRDERNSGYAPEASVPSETPFQKFFVDTLGGGVAAPLTDGDSVYALGSEGVTALDPNTGEVSWSTGVDEVHRYGGTVANGTVYVTDHQENVRALDAEDGSEKWRSDSVRTRSAPTVASVPGLGETVFVEGLFETMVALDADDGEQVWEIEPEGASAGPVTVVDDTLLYTTNGGVYAVDAVDGSHRWSNDSVSELSGVGLRPVVGDGAVYVATAANGLAALELDTGTVRWQNSERRYASGATVADGTVYYGTLDGLAALDTNDGEELWITREGLDVGHPIAVDGSVYATYTDITEDPVATGVFAVDATDGTEDWVLPGTGYADSRTTPVAVTAGTVCLADPDGYTYGIDADDGIRQWKYENGGVADSTPVVADGTIFLSNGRDELAAFDAQDGSSRWRRSNASTSDQPPTVRDGTVYTVSDGVHALDAEDGSTEWETTFGNGTDLSTSVTVADGSAYVGIVRNNDNGVVSLDVGDGTHEWEFTAEESAFYPVAVADGTVYWVTDEYVYAIDGDTGSRKWRFDPGTEVSGSPAVADGTVYVGTEADRLYALDADTGREEWQAVANSGIYSTPSVGGGTVVVSGDGLAAFDAVNGSWLWRFDGDGAFFGSSPALTDEMVVATSHNGKAYAVDLEDGSREWSFDTGNALYASPAIADGAVFLGNSAGFFYRLGEGGGGSVVDRFDEDGDGSISTAELNAAISAWATGDLSTSGLNAVIQAWVTSG